MSGRPARIDFNVVNQISLKADSLATLHELHARVVVERMPDIATVTHGNALSVYVPDPEENRLELYLDLPWYVSQPTRVPINFGQGDAALMAAAEAHARLLPGFVTRDTWRARMAAQMGASVEKL